MIGLPLKVTVKHKLATKKTCCTPRKKKVISHPYLPISATFFCSQGGRCGAVRLYDQLSLSRLKMCWGSRGDLMKKPLMRCGTIQTIRQIAIAWLELKSIYRLVFTHTLVRIDSLNWVASNKQRQWKRSYGNTGRYGDWGDHNRLVYI